VTAPAAYRDIWQRKPALRAVYGDIYRRIGAQMNPGRTLEIGGGSGNLKALRPQTVSTDIQFAPWLDAVCDAQRLPFAAGQFDNVVMVDVLHHIEFPLQALREFYRVLRPGGRLIFCEPAITPLGGLFYRLFHEEPVDMSADPLAEGTISAGRDPWLSNQAIPTLLTGKYRDRLADLLPGLQLAEMERFSFLAYPLSGGFKEWSLLPEAIAKPLLAAEWRMRKLLGPFAAFRLLAVYRHLA
jgi:SAM-dependent methyltransferase